MRCRAAPLIVIPMKFGTCKKLWTWMEDFQRRGARREVAENNLGGSTNDELTDREIGQN